jgi:hypothetical protein
VNQASDEMQKIQGKILHFTPNPKNPQNFDVIVQSDLAPDAIRLAQQLTTTIGTLVVAVSGFYFGSTTVSSAVTAAQSRQAYKPVIQKIDPDHGKQGQVIDFVITGSDLNRTQRVRLVRANEEMACTELLSNPTNIKCQLLVSKDPGDKWDLSVATDDGAEVILRDAFGINKLDVETGSGETSQSRIV